MNSEQKYILVMFALSLFLGNVVYYSYDNIIVIPDKLQEQCTSLGFEWDKEKQECVKPHELSIYEQSELKSQEAIKKFYASEYHYSRITQLDTLKTIELPLENLQDYCLLDDGICCFGNTCYEGFCMAVEIKDKVYCAFYEEFVLKNPVSVAYVNSVFQQKLKDSKQEQPQPDFSEGLVRYPERDKNSPEDLYHNMIYVAWLNISESDLPVYFEYNSNYFYGGKIDYTVNEEYLFVVRTFKCFYENKPNKLEEINLWTKSGRKAKLFFKTSSTSSDYNNWIGDASDLCKELRQKQIQHVWAKEVS